MSLKIQLRSVKNIIERIYNSYSITRHIYSVQSIPIIRFVF